MFDLLSLARSVVFAVVYAGIEFRYVNRREEEWTKLSESFQEKYLFWVITPYHALLLLPLFVVSGFSPSITAWAGNVFVIAVVEDIAYFAWRGRMAARGEWTTKLFGSIQVGGYAVPVWWPLDVAVAGLLYWLPV